MPGKLRKEPQKRGRAGSASRLRDVKNVIHVAEFYRFIPTFVSKMSKLSDPVAAISRNRLERGIVERPDETSPGGMRLILAGFLLGDRPRALVCSADTAAGLLIPRIGLRQLEDGSMTATI